MYQLFSTSLAAFLFLLQFQAKECQVLLMRPSDCEIGGSCYPATGNLLIGREHKLKASSTCGTRGPQRYCIVSHLEEPKKCFYCDSRRSWSPGNIESHQIENVVKKDLKMRKKSWWQSENGLANVSIQLDLDAEFHFTHLIMTFKTFRPASMLIERSSDKQKTWKTYRYFAFDCAASFPGVSTEKPRNLTDVYCESRYSYVEPSSGGELVFRALPPGLKKTDRDPYDPEIQDLLRITNLRINFTKLHTLGDNLLDNRPEIAEKYYYSLYELVVRGSCSCYGHASRCIPDDPRMMHHPFEAEMVHGRCECNATHHVTGLNCEHCEDFYNDLPWKPAIGKDRNECKRCNCNRHASRCHFDRAVYEASGFVSGGVCDECQHSTMGIKCETCKPYYYRPDGIAIDDPRVCQECGCDLRGSKNRGICDSQTDEQKGLKAGRCHCKRNVQADQCSECKDGFWDLDKENPDGCTQCTCYLVGTVGNRGCDKFTGHCTCKRLVTGENCDKCLPEHYGLSEEPEGCKPCDCDAGGALDNNCEASSGQCQCRPNFSGRRCEKPESGYYCPAIDYYTYEAEAAELEGGATVDLRESGGVWTGTGYARVTPGSRLVFVVDNIALAMDYTIVIQYDSQHVATWDGINIQVVRPGPTMTDGPCSNVKPTEDFLRTYIPRGKAYAEVRPKICLETGVEYRIQINFDAPRGFDERTASMLIDSIILVPTTESLRLSSPHDRSFEQYQCRHLTLSRYPNIPKQCENLYCAIGALLVGRAVVCNCDPTGSTSGLCAEKGGKCDCKPSVVGRRCDQCAPGTFGFGPQGCTACECNSVGSLDNLCNLQTGQCKCHTNVYGRKCDECEPGFWNFPNCEQCVCNGHADICDQKTGACIECRDLSAGPQCDRCQDGYYGDPRIGVNLACRPCPCPGGPGSNRQHADTCYLTRPDGETDVIRCNCHEGYVGERCDQCAVNYFGDPEEAFGSCERCECNSNIDFRVEESCDAKNGKCLKCLYNTEGDACEHCVSGYFGNATSQQCNRCVCNSQGTNAVAGSCDRVTGQCPCHANVTGARCDACEENHWNISSGVGCADCACDPRGVISRGDDQIPYLQCNLLDGQCHCKEGRGGRRCSECQDFYWGDPTVDCKRCDCDYTGSRTYQCDRKVGVCLCHDRYGGPRCTECARGYTGSFPDCQPCGECFQQWDERLQALKAETRRLISEAGELEDSGVTSVYDEEFEAMETQLGRVGKTLDNANVTASDLDELKARLAEMQDSVKAARERQTVIDQSITEVRTDVDLAEAELESFRTESEALKDAVAELQQNATSLRESDVEGAHNITREAYAESMRAKARAEQALDAITQSESARNQAKDILEKNQDQFKESFDKSKKALTNLETQYNSLTNQIPGLNEMVCGANAECDDVCGGAGCGHCGGSACPKGAVTKAHQAHEVASEAKAALEEKLKRANDMLIKLDEADLEAKRALGDAKQAFSEANRAAERANITKNKLETLLDRMTDFLSGEKASPAEIRTMAQEVLNMTIPLKADEIEQLSMRIRETLGKLRNIDVILAETRGNLTRAEQLSQAASRAKNDAQGILTTVKSVIDALDRAQEAQTGAEDAVRQATADIGSASDNLATIQNTTVEVTERAGSAEGKIERLGKQLDDIKVGYLQVDRDLENAQKIAGEAIGITNYAKDNLHVAEEKEQEARKLLSLKGGIQPSGSGGAAGGTPPDEGDSKQASNLKERATALLGQTKTYLANINELDQQINADEDKLEDYSARIQSLLGRIQTHADALQTYVTNAENCQCSPGVIDPETQPDQCPLVTT